MKATLNNQGEIVIIGESEKESLDLHKLTADAISIGYEICLTLPLGRFILEGTSRLPKKEK